MPGYLLTVVMEQYVALKKPLFSETDSSYPSTTSVCYNGWHMKEDQRLYQERIVADPRILAGKPVVKGTRIGVDLVLLKGCTKTTFDPLRAASSLAAKVSYA